MPMGNLKAPDVDLIDYMRARYGYHFVKKGSAVKGPCPWDNEHHSGERNPNFRIWPDGQSWFCHCDGEGGRLWDLVAKDEGLPEFGAPGFDETIRFVCDVMNIEPEVVEDYTPDVTDRIRAVYRRIAQMLVPIELSDDNHHFQRGPNGAVYYRGLDVHSLRQRGIGMIPSGGLDSLYDEFGQSILDRAGLLIGSNQRLDWLQEGVVFVRKSHYGSPVAIAVRRYSEFTGYEITEGKYFKNKNHPAFSSGKYLFGYHQAQRAISKDASRLYIVEGEFDQVALSERGITNVVATGNGQLTEDHADVLRELDCEIFIVTDSDANGAGLSNSVRMAKRFWDLDFKFLRLPGTGVDPDDFVQENGTEAFEKLPYLTRLQMCMLGEKLDGDWTWRFKEQMTDQYMQWIVKNPSGYDERHINFIARLSGQSVSYLQSWLFWARNQSTLQTLQQSNRPVQVNVS